VLAALCSRVGLDATEVAEKIASAPYKQKLRDNTEELMERGGFGTPTVFIDQDDMYFGNDRLALVREALRGNLS
jgi:2-hydroxychromene-2-carboxylate isomerase